MAKSPSRTRIAKTDRRSDLRRAGLGTRIELNENEAKTVRRIFKWAADGVGVGTMVERLNNEGVPRPSGKRWTKSPISRILNNERYLGRQIWGQRSVEHEPGTGRIITRPNPRTAWKVQERPELRIVSDELWNRAQETRAEIRKAVAPKRNLARGKDARFHSKHLLTGFGTCQVCGGAMSSVSGGKGSPRLGCRRSWAEGRSACPNRLTIRIKVAEPQILARLQGELLKAAVTAYITKAVEEEIRKSLAEQKPEGCSTQRLLEQERQKLQNLVAAIEGGSNTPSVLLKAISEREASIKRLEGQLKRETQKMTTEKLPQIQPWVHKQLQDLTGLLKTDPVKVKAEFRRLNLQLTFNPIESKPRAHYEVKGQCDLSALVFSFLHWQCQGAVLDHLRAQLGLASVIYFGGVITFFAVAARRSSSAFRNCSERANNGAALSR